MHLAVTDAERIFLMGKLVEDLSLVQNARSAGGNADVNGVIENIPLMCSDEQLCPRVATHSYSFLLPKTMQRRSW